MEKLYSDYQPSTINYPPTRTPFTLQPLRDAGPDALDAHDTPLIAKATVCNLEVTSESAKKIVTNLTADDIFKAPALSGEPLRVPRTGILTSATVNVQLSVPLKPIIVVIRPPDTIQVDDPSALVLIEPWLIRRHFKAARHLAKAAIILLLAILSIAASPFDDDPDDDPDDEDECSTLCAA